VLEIEIRPDQTPLVAVINRWDGAQCGSDVCQLVKLERGIGLQQVEVARVRQCGYGIVGGVNDIGQSCRIAGDRSFLVETVEAPGYPFWVVRPRERCNFFSIRRISAA